MKFIGHLVIFLLSSKPLKYSKLKTSISMFSNVNELQFSAYPIVKVLNLNPLNYTLAFSVSYISKSTKLS